MDCLQLMEKLYTFLSFVWHAGDNSSRMAACSASVSVRDAIYRVRGVQEESRKCFGHMQSQVPTWSL